MLFPLTESGGYSICFPKNARAHKALQWMEQSISQKVLRQSACHLLQLKTGMIGYVKYTPPAALVKNRLASMP